MDLAPRIGTAGWSIPKQHTAAFPATGTHLERYARRFSVVEINSSFYRSHQIKTYERWAASVPDGFRFSVKTPKEITHTRRLEGATRLFTQFVREASALGDRLGPLLVQLPPSLKYSADAAAFFAMVRDRFDGDIVCEPRHTSWFAEDADDALKRMSVARAIADPPTVPASTMPGGWRGFVYRRMHGSPRIYYSAYTADTINAIAADMYADGLPADKTWCIFDNTALGEATGNALQLSAKNSRSKLRRTHL